MLKSHIYILQYLEEPDLPSTFQNEPVSFLRKKKISCLFLSCTRKDKAETYFLVITTVETRGCCQCSHRCCLVTVVFLLPCVPSVGARAKPAAVCFWSRSWLVLLTSGVHDHHSSPAKPGNLIYVADGWRC